MARKMMLSLLAMLMFAQMPAWGASGAAPSDTTATVPVPAGWKLVWHDEFNKPGPPNPKDWTPERGYVRNHESQYYKLANAQVRDGMLVITAKKQRVKNAKYEARSKDWRRSKQWTQYTSASLKTQGKLHWLYGRFEMRAKLPAGSGMWPAFWMLGSDVTQVGWPRCGEIDIMEWLGRLPKVVHGTVHWGSPAAKRRSAGKVLQLPDSAAKQFHVYAIDWSPRLISFYVDNQKYFTFDVDKAGSGKNNPFRKPQFILLNLAMGGWGGKIDSHALPARYEIDYVRVYQKIKANAGGHAR